MVYRIRFLLTNMTVVLKNLNKFVNIFFAENDSADLESKWMTAKNQTVLKNILNKSEKCRLKDPDAPKRGKSAYLYFCAANRDKVVKDLGPTAKATEITKELGVRWNSLKNDPKRAKELQTFQNQADSDKERYQTELKDYTPSENFAKKVKTGPKRGKSAYLFFCDANRELVVKDLGKDVKATEITKELGKRWELLKKQNKTKEFDDLAAEDKVRYFTEKNQMQSENSSAEENPKPAKKTEPKKTEAKKTEAKKTEPKKTEAKKTEAKKTEAKKTEAKKTEAKKTEAKKTEAKKTEPKKTEPKKTEPKKTEEDSGSKKLSGYQLFCAEKREEYKKKNPSAKPSAINKIIASEWKKLSADQQAQYKGPVAQSK